MRFIIEVSAASRECELLQRCSLRWIALLVVIVCCCTRCSNSPTTQPNTTTQDKVLVFSKTTGFRHDSIPDGIAAIQQLGRDNQFAVDASEDSAAFTDKNLAQYK